MISVEDFSDLLLNLGRESRALPMRAFQAYAMERLRRHLAFDAAIWGMTTQMEDDSHIVHDVYSEGTPENCGDQINFALKFTEPRILIARTCLSSPGICFNFGPEQLHTDIRQMLVTQYFGAMHVLCTMSRSDIPQLLSFLSLHRSNAACAFSEDDRQLKQFLMPHLADMMQINRVMQIASVRSNTLSSQTAMAVVDEVGVLCAAEPGFGSHLRNEWPEWDGPFLPKPLLTALSSGRKRYIGMSFAFTFQQVYKSTLVTIARRTPADMLSPREYAVANEFANGESYKEVARHLGMSPATVRHHLRIIYEKLGVTDKGELSKILNQGVLLSKTAEITPMVP